MENTASCRIKAVARMLSPYYKTLEDGSLAFTYTKDGMEQGTEYYNDDLHYVPATSGLWTVSHFSVGSVRNLYLFPSAIEAICYFQLYPEKLQGHFPWAIVALGLYTTPVQVLQLSGFSKAKKHFVFGNDILGKVADCKVALWCRKLDVSFYLKDGLVRFSIKGKTYSVSEDAFSLFRFQELTGLRNLGRTIKPPSPYHSFYELITNPIT